MYEKIKPYIEKGLIAEQKHPENESVRIFNYTPLCQYSGAWDEVTMNCRGLILNISTEEVLSNPFPKFFNYEEYVQKGWPIPTEIPIVTRKLDGWCGITYWLNGQPWVATRGSFTSVGALWATDWLRKNVGSYPVPTDTTVMLEIVSPDTRIVLDYKTEDFGLYVLSARDIKSGLEVPFSNLNFKGYAPMVTWTGYESLKALNERNQEGFVLFYPSSNLRIKIKFEDYVRLHKIVTGLSVKGIWEALKNNQELALDSVPDELYDWVNQNVDRLHDEYQKIEDAALEDLKEIVPQLPNLSNEDPVFKKAYAELAKNRKYPGILFAMRDGKEYHNMIWDMLRPKGLQTFKRDEI